MRTLRLIAALLALLTALSFAACAKNPEGVPVGMAVASPDFAAYRLCVPSSWIVTQSGGAVSAYVSETDPANVSVMSWEMPFYDSTVEEWWDSYNKEFHTVFTEFKLLSIETTVLDGTAARKYVYTGTLGTAALGAKTYRYTQYAAVRDGVVYVITCTELASEETDHAEEFSAIAAAFTWND